MTTTVLVEVTIFHSGDPLPAIYMEEYTVQDNVWVELPVMLGMFLRDSWKKIIKQCKEWEDKNSST